MKYADVDRNKSLRLLDEMSAVVSTCAYGVVQAVLAAASSTGNASLAGHLYRQVQCVKASLIPSFLAVIPFHAAAGQPEKACDMYERHVKAQNTVSSGHVRQHALIDAAPRSASLMPRSNVATRTWLHHCWRLHLRTLQSTFQ